MKKEKVAIFGAGNCGRLIGSQLIKDSKIELIAFIDNDENKAGKIVNLDSIESSSNFMESSDICGGGGGNCV
ncbi:nucleoside-diphosphate sugar epimerase/dehydratase [Helicobacter jaachi]|uniref:nucleoside-diphosphate sugar epimerase/dehydratase n=1 Tax=Helicobacter jaachi TaxID=1677920 RepID=UPI001EE7A5DB|nr:hypothetical protein [Helicobacter jaachi]